MRLTVHRRATWAARCENRSPTRFLFGLTGTPINRADKNTFYAFGAEEDANGYMNRHGFEDSIRDGATKELHFEPRLVDLHVDQDSIDEGYKELTTGLSDEERDQLEKHADCSYLMRLWEAISPDPVLSDHETDYRWLVQIYESVKPVSNTGRLLWHRLGAKTIDLIRENVHVEAVLGSPDPGRKAKEIEIKVSRRLRGHLHDPQFKELAERLEELKNRHEQGLLLSVEFLKELLDLAKNVVATEQTVPPIEEEERGKTALTELFEEAKNGDTPIMVERVVADIDEIVCAVRFDNWQNTHAGEREIKKALRKTLFKYQLHQDQELFDRAYGYIQQYY